MNSSCVSVIPIQSDILQSGDNLCTTLTKQIILEDKDILVVSSKAIATVEGAHIALEDIAASDEAEKLSSLHAWGSAASHQAILNETKRLNGTIVSYNEYCCLTELRPNGLKGSILVANAGLDQSNTMENTVIGWPHNSVESVKNLKQELEKASNKTLGILLTDSCCLPRRLGTIAIGLVACGFSPIEQNVGQRDVFDRTLQYSNEARGDQLATMANYVMGNSNEQIPAVIIRNHGLKMTEFCGWVEGIKKEDDLFQIS